MTRESIANRSLVDLCLERWQAGRDARGLALDEPFDGDPLTEMAEEIIDARNYLEVIGRAHGGAWFISCQVWLDAVWSKIVEAARAEAKQP